MNQFLKLKSLKTLLIDDNAIIRDTMKTIFAQKGCLLKAFETAEEGLQALEKERFDIIISDLQLPGIDGVEFFKRAMSLARRLSEYSFPVMEINIRFPRRLKSVCMRLLRSLFP